MVSPANTYPCLTVNLARRLRHDRAGQVLPVGDAQLRPRRRARRLPGRGRRRVHAERGRQERLHPQRQGGLRPRRRDDDFRKAAKSLGIKIAGFEAWDPEGDELHVADAEDQVDRGGRGLPRRPDRRERRPGDQGQGRGARAERRRGQAARAGRLHDQQSTIDEAGDGGEGHVHVASPACRSTSSRARPSSSSTDFEKGPLQGKSIDPYAIYGGQAAHGHARRDRGVGRHAGPT